MDKETIIQLLADGVISNEAAAKYFPELKESKDECIKKELINAINLAYDCGIAITKENRDKYLAWIERQGEQKPVVIIPKFRVGDVIHLKNSCAEYTIKSISDGHYYGNGFSFNIVGCDRDYELVKQKPTNVCEGCNNVKGCIACVDGSEWAHIEEQEPAWSERDKKMSRFIGNAITADGASEYLESKGIQVIDAHVWLDELKDRVQPQITWKPSEHELEVLKLAAEKDGTCLMGLYKQLKKLRESKL